MAAQRDAKGRFVKGNCAAKNRRSAPHEFREMAREYGPEALLKLVNIMRNSPENGEIIRAATVIIERAYGKPQQPEDEGASQALRVVIEQAKGERLDE